MIAPLSSSAGPQTIRLFSPCQLSFSFNANLAHFCDSSQTIILAFPSCLAVKNSSLAHVCGSTNYHSARALFRFLLIMKISPTFVGLQIIVLPLPSFYTVALNNANLTRCCGPLINCLVFATIRWLSDSNLVLFCGSALKFKSCPFL